MGDKVRGDTGFGVVNSWLIYGTYSPPKITIFSMIDKISYIWYYATYKKNGYIFLFCTKIHCKFTFKPDGYVLRILVGRNV